MNTSDHSFGEEVIAMEANTSHSRQSYASSNGGGYATDAGESSKNLKSTLATEETKVVRSISWFLLVILIFFATVIAGFVYVFTSRAEQDSFEREFFSNGNKVVNGFSSDSYRKMQSMFALSKVMTGYALHSNSTWPFVTIPNLAEEFEPYLSLTEAVALTVFPIVPHELRAAWEEYSVDNQGWIDESLSSTRTFDISLSGNSSISPYIKSYVGVDTSPGVWLPWWQYYPVIENRWFVNFNRLAWPGFAESLKHIMKGRALLSDVSTFESGLDFQSSQDYTFFDQLMRSKKEIYSPGEPFSFVFYPIMEHFGDDAKVAAVMTATVYWKSYLESVEGITCIVKNSAGQAFTYEVSTGGKINFLGMGDFHDSRFDDMELTAEYTTANRDDHDHGADNIKYTGVPVDEDHIVYHLSVYPTKELQDNHLSSKPVAFCVSIAVGFVVSAVIFVVFNKYVERRQKVVMRSAAKTTAVVESMFPSNVRDRLLAGVEVADGKESGAKRITEQSSTDGDGSSHYLSTDPIADEFEDCTIIFADIKGFTAWSEKQEPVQVFRLLESLYAAFDKVAISLGVYKVETVGDCYVAVTGLPEPNKHHAVIMCKFSKAIQKKFYTIIHDLERTMGAETGRLELRTGIHSGAVTAGVIRGYNARFQHSYYRAYTCTASRMESTGEGGKIQISATTAALLNSNGKSNWYTPREDTVFCKGKGYLQTCWLHCSGSSAGSNEESKAFVADSLSKSDTRCANHMNSDGLEESEELRTNSGHVFHGNTDLLEDALRLRMIGMQKNSAHKTKRKLVESKHSSRETDHAMDGNIYVNETVEV